MLQGRRRRQNRVAVKLEMRRDVIEVSSWLYKGDLAVIR
jgi:hypothetical protein